MNRDEKIIKALNDLEFDEAEFEKIDVELDDLESKKLENEYKKRIFNREYCGKRKLKKIAAGLLFVCIIGGTAISIPVIAKSIELSTFSYKELNDSDEYLNYEDAIGKSINIDGVTYELSDIKINQDDLVTIKVLISNNKKINEDTLSKINANGWFKESYKYGKEGGSVKRIGENKVEVTFRSTLNKDIIEDIFFMNFNLGGKTNKLSIKIKLKDDNNILPYKNFIEEEVISENYNMQVSNIKSTTYGTRINLKIIGKNKYLSDLKNLNYSLWVDGNEYILGIDADENGSVIGTLGHLNFDKDGNFEGCTLESETFISKESLNYDDISEDSELKIKVYNGTELLDEIKW